MSRKPQALEGFTITVPDGFAADEVRAAAIMGIQNVFNEDACRRIGVSTVSTGPTREVEVERLREDLRLQATIVERDQLRECLDQRNDAHFEAAEARAEVERLQAELAIALHPLSSADLIRCRTEVERLQSELAIASFDAEVPIRELREQIERLREAISKALEAMHGTDKDLGEGGQARQAYTILHNALG